MVLFWDTSAIVALIHQEPHSAMAREASAAATCSYAWSWLTVEAEAALARRGATPAQLIELAKHLAALRFEDIPSPELAALCSRNRNWRLRAADAGHLFCFTRVASVIPDLQLVTFDDEMLAVARRLKLAVWPPTPPSREKGGAVREQAGVSRARRKKAPRKQP